MEHEIVLETGKRSHSELAVATVNVVWSQKSGQEVNFTPSWLKVPDFGGTRAKPSNTSHQVGPTRVSQRPQYGRVSNKGLKSSSALSDQHASDSLSTVSLSFRGSVDFSTHAAPSRTATHPHLLPTTRNPNDSKNCRNNTGHNGSICSRSLEQQMNKTRPHSRHDFRELAHLKDHSKQGHDLGVEQPIGFLRPVDHE